MPNLLFGSASAWPLSCESLETTSDRRGELKGEQDIVHGTWPSPVTALGHSARISLGRTLRQRQSPNDVDLASSIKCHIPPF